MTKMFWVTSMYGYKNKAPLVTLTVPDGGMHQMEPKEARDLALNLLECAEAAEQDAFIIEWAIGRFQLSEQNAAMILGDFRDWRNKRSEQSI